MNEPRTSRTAPIIATVMVLTFLGAYVAGYFLLSKRGTAATPAGLVLVHSFKYQWLADVYEPATRVETALTGRQVWVGTYAD
jgi:hypothetical protein